MIENQMVRPAAAPEEMASDPIPEREATCIACGKVGYLVRGEWMNELFMDRDEDGREYLDGQSLAWAGHTKRGGWVCSEACRSDAMYQGASRDDRELLDRVRDACVVLAELGEKAQEIVEGADLRVLRTNLADSARQFLDATCDISVADDCSEWTNRPTREDRRLLEEIPVGGLPAITETIERERKRKDA